MHPVQNTQCKFHGKNRIEPVGMSVRCQPFSKEINIPETPTLREILPIENQESHSL